MIRHSQLAQEVGMNARNIFILSNGEVLTFTRGNFPKRREHVQSGAVLVDGNAVSGIKSEIMKERREISEDGILMIGVAIDDRGNLLSPVAIETQGVFIADDIHEVYNELYATAENAIKEFAGSRVNIDSLKKNIKSKKIKVRQTFNKLNNNIKKCKMNIFRKCVILIIILLYFIYIIQYLSLFKLKNNNYIDIKQKPIINDKKLNETINEIENIYLKRKIKCFPNNDKIYWKNEKDLGIAKLIKLAKASDKYKMSFENENDFYKRENPSISIIITIYNQERFINKSYAFIQDQES